MPKTPSRQRTHIQAGDLRRPLTIATRGDSPISKTGGSKPVYIPLYPTPVWAMDEVKITKSFDQAEKLITALYHTYTIRFNSAIVAGMYAHDPDFASWMYIQGAQDPDGTRHWMKLTCTEIEG